jgi:hypothetical protein
MARSSTTSRRSAIRKIFLRPALSALALFLAGCGTGNGGDWSNIIDAVQTSMAPGDKSITLDQAAAVPFATMGVRIGDGAQMLVVLAADSGGSRLWTSAAKIAITTRGGRVVRTAGLARNIDTVSFQAGDPLRDGLQDDQPRQSLRLVDYWDLNRYSVPLRCVTVSRGRDDVVILGKTIATTRVDESCEGATIDWTFTDSYWIGSDGTVWKSIQHIHPDYDPIELEILRPPAAPGG